MEKFCNVAECPTSADISLSDANPESFNSSPSLSSELSENRASSELEVSKKSPSLTSIQSDELSDEDEWKNSSVFKSGGSIPRGDIERDDELEQSESKKGRSGELDCVEELSKKESSGFVVWDIAKGGGIA